ncbi:tyrosinase family protein [Rhodovibrio sodomensis]|nr:tyrosinase family protein [Rhodovibrio sodomensis]
MTTGITRRGVLQGAAAVGALSVGGMSIAGCEQIVENIRNRPVREDITTLNPTGSTIQTLEQGISAMRALPSSDRRNWTNFARIHLDFCPHGNWFFLPWHRAYLFSLERIIQELTGNPDFGLPYWNWQKDRSIPSVYWTTSSPLYHANRAATASDALPDSATGPAVISSVLSQTDFELFGSFRSSAPRGGTGGGQAQLERTPHNYVHGFVGGDMATYMSPLDPIFFAHHNFIDCIWAHWNIDRQNNNTSDSVWTQYSYTEFPGPGGGSWSTTSAATTLMPLLSYRFAESTKGSDTAARQVAEADRSATRERLERGSRTRLSTQPLTRIQAPATLRLNQVRTFNLALPAQRMNQLTAVEPDDQQLLLSLEETEGPNGEDIILHVFLNNPDAGPDTPTTDPTYAGLIAFFEDQAEMDMAQDYILDITQTVRDLRQRGIIEPGEPIRPNVVAVRRPTGKVDAQATVRIGRAQLSIGRPTQVQ